ncbi:MAG: Tn3 family transposase, partial [Planctomycetaceae bacterium]|nr:Tn3 family transposase [Planctomycetaceae bacterium]
MPGQLFTDAERRRLGGSPDRVSHEDLVTFDTLTRSDRAVVNPCADDAGRLGFALQRGTLRYLGSCPDDLGAAPAEVVQFLADQLKVPPEGLSAYGRRAQTRTDHYLAVQDHLGYRKAGPEVRERLARWLLDRALEHDRPQLLWQLACEKLAADKVVRPGVTVRERMVVAARRGAERETMRRLAAVLDGPGRALLDRLLTLDGATDRTPLTWLRQGEVATTPPAILSTLERRATLSGWGVDRWDLRALHPNRLKFLARLGQRSTTQALQRAPAERRYPILVAFLRQALEETTDEILDLVDRCLARASARAERKLEESRLANARTTDEAVRLFGQIGRIVLDPTAADRQVRAAIYRQVTPEVLREAAERTENPSRRGDDHQFDFLADRYDHLRQFTPQFLAAVAFRSNRAGAPVLEAVATLRDLNARRQREVPPDAPVQFVPARWRPHVVGRDGAIDRPDYELCVPWELRAALRAGNVWLETSRRFTDPETYLISRERWPHERQDVCRLLQLPEDGSVRLGQRRAELEEELARLERDWPQNDSVRIERGRLVLTPLSAEEPPAGSVVLQEKIARHLPRVDLADLLLEVDGWTGFTRPFEHAGGREPRTKDLLVHLHAAVLAQACNFGPTTMAEVAELSYKRLAWCTNWYLREETLRPAIAAVVDSQHRQPLSQSWGGGTLSSSDGQRFPVPVRSRTATALPRYFGYGQGLTLYSWTSDQFAQYGSKVIPATVRDATYVLDAILDNETELTILEHTTDTAGYTELVFALFDPLGLQFAPRIRDLGDQRLYRFDSGATYRHLGPLLKGKVHERRIGDHWDDLLRVAGSLKRGPVTASLLIGQLQASPRRNALTRALQEYGRVAKTLF